MKSSKAAIMRRQKDILLYLEKQNAVKITELSETFHVSLSTMRRDVAALARAGKLVARFGTAELPPSYGGLPNFDSEPLLILNGPEKEAIAKCAAGLLESGDSVFMNSSSTALRIFQYLTDKPITIITNNGRSLNIQRCPGTELVLIGGQVGNTDPNGTLMKTSMTGDFAVDMISKISATKCVLGVSGISVQGGLTSLAIQDPAVNKAMIQHCGGAVIVVADHRKIGVRHNFHFGSIHNVTHLVTDSKSDPEELQRIRDAGITVYVVDAEG